MMPEMPIEKPSLEPGQNRKGVRDLVVGALAAVAVALVTVLLENADLIAFQLDIDTDTVVALISMAAGLFGWRTIRKSDS